MGMTIDKAIKDYEQSVTQNKLFIKAHQSMMEPSEIKEYRYYIDRDNLAIETMRKYQKIARIMERTVDDGTSMYDTLQEIEEVVEDGNDTTNTGSN